MTSEEQIREVLFDSPGALESAVTIYRKDPERAVAKLGGLIGEEEGFAVHREYVAASNQLVPAGLLALERFLVDWESSDVGLCWLKIIRDEDGAFLSRFCLLSGVTNGSSGWASQKPRHWFDARLLRISVYAHDKKDAPRACLSYETRRPE